MTTELIVAAPIELPLAHLNALGQELKELALNGAALIGKVTNAEENDKAVKSQIELRRVMALFEKNRKTLKEPALEYGRKVDNFVKGELEELDKENGRVSALVGLFAEAEQARVREEQRLQQAEIDRIEREKQAELRRIAEEQAAREAEARRIQEEADRKVREAQEAAAKLAAEATNKKQREAAEAARQEALKRQAAAEVERQRNKSILAEQATAAAKSIASIEETAQIKTAISAKPIETTRSEGQIVKTDWEITVTNPYELAKFHPDCVLEIKPAISQIKAYLNQGRTIRGIKATQITKANVKYSSTSRSALIEV